ncbi:MAG: GGDEF domain-containing protein [Campylobacterota bacterium]|nr:GGDEF domain-containing protein [Campylobacterota bacterium]
MNHYSADFFYQREISQAYVRILFISTLLLAIYSASYFNLQYVAEITDHQFFSGCLLLIIAISHLLGLKKLSTQNTSIRKYFILFIDIIAVSFAIWVFDENGIVFIPLYLWVIIGFTLRFGKLFFPISLTSTYIAIIILALYHPYWIDNFALIISLLIAVTVIPLFVLKLQEDINKKNVELEYLLKEMEHHVNHDTLTKLPNRHYFYSKLHQFIKADNDFALLFIDLDGFKDVNDTHGHEDGDTVLKEVADRLKEGFGEDHFIARLGGDEFVCIYSTYHCSLLNPTVQNILKNIIKPYGIYNEISGISASIGVSRYPDDTKDSFGLKNYADRAMYQAKRNGKNQMVYYEDLNR